MSAEEFTPDTNTVRFRFALDVDASPANTWTFEEGVAQFDRWLAVRDAWVKREAAERAWDQGCAEAWRSSNMRPPSGDSNPYRNGADQ